MKKKNQIQILIKLKGLSFVEFCRLINVPYFSAQKMITGGSPWTTKDGEVHFRECRYIREAIADWLGYPYELIWGPGNEIFLNRLIREEIEREAETEKRRKLQALNLL